jgi:hypothetical protein
MMTYVPAPFALITAAVALGWFLYDSRFVVQVGGLQTSLASTKAP